MRRMMAVVAGVFGLGAVILLGAIVTPAQDQPGGGEMDKTLKQFTIGDLFPASGQGVTDTATAWKEVASKLKEQTAKRLQNIRAAIPKVKAKITEAKTQSKTAEKSKDFAAAGAAQGTLRTEEAVMAILERLEGVAEAQDKFVGAWTGAAEALKKFAEADAAFEQYRSKGIERPEPGAQDMRLDMDGYKAFQQHSQSIEDLGGAFKDVGAALEALAASRGKFATDLEKGGHIQTPPVK